MSVEQQNGINALATQALPVSEGGRGISWSTGTAVTTVEYTFAGTQTWWNLDTRYTEYGYYWDENDQLRYGLIFDIGHINELSAAWQAATRAAFQLYSNVANINFVEVQDVAGSDITIHSGTFDGYYGEGVVGMGEFPEVPESAPTPKSDIILETAFLNWIDGTYYGQSTIDGVYNGQSTGGSVTPPASESFNTIIHEIGHALGLTHPGGEDGYNSAYTVDGTVMSYNNGDIIDTNEVGGLQIYDIAAIQAIYGANHNFAAGDDVYRLTGANKKYTIWDGNGVDTLDASSSNTWGSVLDLREGLDYVSSVGSDRVWIAFGANIENARGGSGNDVIYGNALANRLEGGAGRDTLVGGGGNDTLIGGDGDDILRGVVGSSDILEGGIGADRLEGGSGTGIDTASYASSAQAITIDMSQANWEGGGLSPANWIGTGGDAVGDQWVSIEAIIGTNGNDRFILGGGPSVILTGGAGDDTFVWAPYSDGVAMMVITDFGTGQDIFDLTAFTMLHQFSDLHLRWGLLSSGGTRVALNIGDQEVRFINIDLASLDASDFIFAPIPNHAPERQVETLGVLNVYAGNSFSFTLPTLAALFTDADNDVLTYKLNELVYDITGQWHRVETLPDWLQWDEATNTFSGTLDNAVSSLDDYILTLVASDGEAEASIEFTLDVHSNVIEGTAGADQRTGTLRNDVIRGYEGNDNIWGGAGNDRLEGGKGNDVMQGQAGDDKLYGGDGDDVLNGGAGKDEFNGGAGVDLVSYLDATSRVILNLATDVNGGYALGDQFREDDLPNTPNTIENLRGSAYADSITGDAGDNVLYGLAGNDYILGGAGNDRLEGGAGNDVMQGQAGDDTLLGGDGDDALNGGSGRDKLNGGAGVDLASYMDATGRVILDLVVTKDENGNDQNNNGGVAEGDAFIGIENLRGSRYGDSITGDEKGNVLYGLAGDDSVFGGDGHDFVFGGDGNDYLDGGVGKDTLTGGIGGDTFVFSHLADSMVTEGDVITDFEHDVDHIDLRGVDLQFDDLTLVENGGNTLVTTVDGGGFSIEVRGVVDEGDFFFS